MEALTALTESLKGNYHKLAELDADVQKSLAEEKLTFDDSDRFV